jgi:hypothetical protein
MMCCNQNFATAFLFARVLFAVTCGNFMCGLCHTTTSSKKFPPLVITSLQYMILE